MTEFAARRVPESTRAAFATSRQREHADIDPDRLAEILFAANPYVRAVERVLEMLPDLLPGEKRNARDLAVRVCHQHLESRAPFPPGTTVRGRSAPFEVAVVVGCKPAGFREGAGWDYVNRRPIEATPWPSTLVWTARPDGRGISQSRAEDWIVVDA